MELIESTKVSNLCDYNFGDQASIIHNLPNGFMKKANFDNKEFVDLYEKFVSEKKKLMTLFIDNIRLYKRKIPSVKKKDETWVENLMKDNDLLNLCGKLDKMKFVIFTGHEDTPIDDCISDKIPPNVLSIYGVNTTVFNNRVVPFPYGVQRKLTINDNRKEILKSFIDNTHFEPEKLLYVNHSVSTNIEERSGINEIFLNKHWSTVDTTRLDYKMFLSKILKHKFMVCPIGNAIDCHRNWEVLYLRRVPIMKKNKFLENLFKDLPILFVNSYQEVNEKLLIENEHLFQRAINFNLSNLDLETVFEKIIKKHSP